jgi:hypothetical protein
MVWWATTFKSPRAKKIGKWLIRFFVGSFFLALIWFQAPWKLILIFVYPIISRQFFTFPKTVQKWESRIIRVGLVCLIIWMLIPSKPDGYRPFQFTEEIAAIEKQRSIPPDQDAYPIYDKLFHAPDPNDRSLPDWAKADIESFTKRTWTAAENPKLSEWLDRRQNILAELKTILQYDLCRFPLEPQLSSSDWEQEQTNILKFWSRMLILTANRYAGQQDVSQAIEACKVLSGLSKHQFEQLTPIQYLIGLGFQSLTCSEVVLLTIQPQTSPDNLKSMDHLLESMTFPGQDHWQKLMEWEKLCLKNQVSGKVYEVNERKQIRFSRASLRKAFEDTDFPRFLQPVGVNYFVVYAWIFLPESPYRFVKCIDEHYDKFIQVGHLDYDPEAVRNKLPPSFRLNHSYVVGFFTDMLASAYEKIPDINSRCLARWQASKIVIGLRRYYDQTGHWPESLTDLQGIISPDLLIDPSNGGEFVYRREGDSFRFYSKGKNGIDDGGLRDKDKKTDDYRYWPIELPKKSDRKAE